MLLNNHAVSNRADLRERTKTMSRLGDRRLSGQFWNDQLVVFTIKVWDKNKNPFWMASLTLTFTRSVELRTHSAWRPHGLQSAYWPREDQCQRSDAHGFSLYTLGDTDGDCSCDGARWLWWFGDNDGVVVWPLCITGAISVGLSQKT